MPDGIDFKSAIVPVLAGYAQSGHGRQWPLGHIGPLTRIPTERDKLIEALDRPYWAPRDAHSPDL